MNTAEHQESCNCREILQLVLDGQATAEQTETFREHLKQCPDCCSRYEVDAAVVEMLKKRCCGGPEPHDLMAQVKAQLNLRG
ncbi:MAG: zf-HC2 domain-containing protein [Bacteroidota bacterium]